jgi:hypothetical protein
MGLISKGISLVLFLGVCAFAAADEVEISGSATGAFNNGLTTIDGLSYTGSTFDVFTFDGFYALGAASASPNIDNLGSFTLTGSPDSYTGDTFTLDVTFTAPSVILGSSTAVYTAMIFGQVISTDTGGVAIEFTGGTDTFNFVNGTDTGYFTFNLNPTSITPGDTVPVTGYGVGSQMAIVPSPAAMICFGVGLVGAGLRKRKTR